jgi:hypothetical protein
MTSVVKMDRITIFKNAISKAKAKWFKDKTESEEMYGEGVLTRKQAKLELSKSTSEEPKNNTDNISATSETDTLTPTDTLNNEQDNVNETKSQDNKSDDENNSTSENENENDTNPKHNLFNDETLVAENDILKVDSKIFKFNNLIYRSSHTFSVKQNSASATFDSIFVKKDTQTGVLVKDEPANPGKLIDTVDETFLEEHKKIKRQLSTINYADFNELVFTPETYFNGVKILYCANYMQLAMLNEFLTFKEILNPIKKLKVYWFKNIEKEDKVYGRTLQKDNVYETILISNNKPIAFICTTRIEK